MRVMIVRSMPSFSMDVYADGITAGLKAIRPDWQITEVCPVPTDRHASSPLLRARKAYERFWAFPRQVQKQAADFDIVHIVDHSEGHIAKRFKHNDHEPNSPSDHSAVVVTCHDLINYFYPSNVQGSVHLPLVSDHLWKSSINGLKQAQHIVNVSDATAKDVNRILDIPFEQMSVVYNAVESDFRPLDEQRVTCLRRGLNASPETCCLLNVGSNHPRKNIDTILSVLALLKQQAFPVQFWKVGCNFTAKQTSWIESQGLSEQIKYLGNPDKHRLIEIYNAADVLIAPSTYEGFGFTLLESMACGTPAITSNTSAMPEVIGDAGVLAAPDDTSAIAQAVIRLHTDTAYRQGLIEKGLDRAKNFTWKNASEQIARIYEALAA